MALEEMRHTRPVWAEVSAEQLQQNYRHLRSVAGPDVDVLAVVKANAYGHGATECAPVLAAAGATWLGVTSVEEGVSVRRALSILPQGMAPRILVMCGVWVGEAEACLQYGLTPVVWERYHLDLLQQAAKRMRRPDGSVDVHLEIDTGMARQGVEPGVPLATWIETFQSVPALRLEGVMTHFASAESVDDVQNRMQARRFENALQQIAASGLHPKLVHAGNTSGVDSGFCADLLQSCVQTSGVRAMTRAGLALYGYALPLQGWGVDLSRLTSLVPVLAWKTRVVSLREVTTASTIGYNATYVAKKPMRLALLPVGYADGFRRALSATNAVEGGAVLVRGVRAPIVGRVSMDLSVADVSDVGGIAIGDEVTLLGRQGELMISASEHARLAQTSVYEVLCGINDRVPRVIVP